MREIDYEFDYLGVKITAKLLLLKDFVKCEKFVESPFFNSKTILYNDFNFIAFEQIVIHCLIPKEEEFKILQSSHMPQSFVSKIIEKFAKEKWSNRDYFIYKTLTCNSRESQYLYLLKKDINL